MYRVSLAPQVGLAYVRQHISRERSACTHTSERVPVRAYRKIQQRNFAPNLSNKKAQPKLCILAPQVGLEPTTYRLTAGCSTIELSRH